MTIKKSLTRLLTATALTSAVVLTVAGCGGSDSASVETSSSGAAPTSLNPADMTDQQQAPQRLTVDVEIKGGQVTPTNAQLQAKVKQPIVIKVRSDVPDELHVHSVPDHTFKIEPKEGQAFQSFQFAVDVPGQVAVELHELNKTVATIQVQP